MLEEPFSEALVEEEDFVLDVLVVGEGRDVDVFPADDAAAVLDFLERDWSLPLVFPAVVTLSSKLRNSHTNESAVEAPSANGTSQEEEEEDVADILLPRDTVECCVWATGMLASPWSAAALEAGRVGWFRDCHTIFPEDCQTLDAIGRVAVTKTIIVCDKPAENENDTTGTMIGLPHY